MSTLKQLLASHGPVATGPAELAARRGIVGTYSIREFEVRSIPISLHPEGEPIGCNCTLTLFRHGAWTLEGRVRNTSSVASYDFDLRVLALGRSAAFAIPHTGTVGSDENAQISLSGTDLSIRALWSDVQEARVEGRLRTEIGGFFGGIVEVLKDLAAYLVFLPFVGAPIAAVIVLGRKVAAELDAPRLLPHWPAGIVAAGGLIIIGSPLGAFALLVAGHAADALRGLKIRPLSSAEIDLARAVFDDSLQLDRIRICNAGDEIRARCISTLDGFSLINVGTMKYPDLMENAARRRDLVHELVHCWQRLYTLEQPWNANRAWDRYVQAIVDDDSKYFPSNAEYAALRPWDDIHHETQAALVESWYGMFTDDAHPMPNSVAAMKHPIYKYLEKDIRPRRP